LINTIAITMYQTVFFFATAAGLRNPSVELVVAIRHLHAFQVCRISRAPVVAASL
jgi:hypothetical protein